MSIENPLSVLVLEYAFREPTQFLSSCLATRLRQKTTMDASEPYIGEMRGTMHKPRANLGADRKFSPGRCPATRS